MQLLAFSRRYPSTKRFVAADLLLHLQEGRITFGGIGVAAHPAGQAKLAGSTETASGRSRQRAVTAFRGTREGKCTRQEQLKPRLGTPGRGSAADRNSQNGIWGHPGGKVQPAGAAETAFGGTREGKCSRQGQPKRRLGTPGRASAAGRSTREGKCTRQEQLKRRFGAKKVSEAPTNPKPRRVFLDGMLIW